MNEKEVKKFMEDLGKEVAKQGTIFAKRVVGDKSKLNHRYIEWVAFTNKIAGRYPLIKMLDTMRENLLRVGIVYDTSPWLKRATELGIANVSMLRPCCEITDEEAHIYDAVTSPFYYGFVRNIDKF